MKFFNVRVRKFRFPKYKEFVLGVKSAAGSSKVYY